LYYIYLKGGQNGNNLDVVNLFFGVQLGLANCIKLWLMSKKLHMMFLLSFESFTLKVKRCSAQPNVHQVFILNQMEIHISIITFSCPWVDTTSLHCGSIFNMMVSQNQVDANACVEVFETPREDGIWCIDVVPFHHMFNHSVHKIIL
jgi:hypothetical protein